MRGTFFAINCAFEKNRKEADFAVWVYIVRADVELKQPAMAKWPWDMPSKLLGTASLLGQARSWDMPCKMLDNAWICLGQARSRDMPFRHVSTQLRNAKKIANENGDRFTGDRL